ncbi:long-chain fatty acid--CoA ligase [Natrarchaeobius chitinivorans]|uniref:Long-chain fatty acid--CoA ligase n=1 Tax=Natrarchaeobius chitinivorans TaxID=1679083 RepID=A0A3N6MGD5_NATCH|nr:long-chain fatty acid--CoA ligase [Natrarchaeobius chitinivorans]
MTLSLARRAARFPDRTAVVDISEDRRYAPPETIHENRVSYAELSELADRTAARLASVGIDAGDTVCLLTRNRIASLALLFACRRLGATLAPISHLLTPVTVERPFDALEPSLVLAEPAQRDLVRSIPFDRSMTLEALSDIDPADVDATDTDAADADPADGNRPQSENAGNNRQRPKPDSDDRHRPLLALHGEGGRPVAAFSERTLEWNCITAVVTWGLRRNDVSPVVSPLATATGLVRNALSLLYVGGRLLLDRAFDPGDTLTAMAEEDATLLVGRKPAFRDLAADSSFDDATRSLERAVPDQSVTADLLDPYHERGVTVTRAYGRLECPAALCQPEPNGVDPRLTPDDGVAVGVPVPDCRVRVVDEDGDVLEGPGTGRLQVSGPVVADGYVNAAGFADDDGGENEATSDRTVKPDDVGFAGGGRFVDGWFDTEEWVRRDGDGGFVLE